MSSGFPWVIDSETTGSGFRDAVDYIDTITATDHNDLKDAIINLEKYGLYQVSDLLSVSTPVTGMLVFHTGSNTIYRYSSGNWYAIKAQFLGSIFAGSTYTDTTLFNNILGSFDVDVQTALETLDNHTHYSFNNLSVIGSLVVSGSGSGLRGDISFDSLRTTDPGSPQEGDLWYNASDHKLKYYDGTNIIPIGSGGGGGGTGSFTGSISAGSVYTDTSNFNNILSASDTDAQKAFETLDDHTHSQFNNLEVIGSIVITNNTDGSSLLYFNTDRDWYFMNVGSDANSKLYLKNGENKFFRIGNDWGYVLFQSQDSAATSNTMRIFTNSNADASLFVDRDSDGDGIKVTLDGNDGIGVHIDSNITGSGQALVVQGQGNNQTVNFRNDGSAKLLVLDQNGNNISLEIDSEATSKPLISFHPLNSNTRGDIAFGIDRTTDPSNPGEGDLWYNYTDHKLKYYDGTNIISIGSGGGTAAGSWPGSVTDDLVIMNKIGASKYYTLSSYWDVTDSAGWYLGGEFSDGGSGSLIVQSVSGILKTSNSGSGTNVHFVTPESVILPLNLNDDTYIYVDYNSGSPVVRASSSDVANGNTTINLGVAYWNGSELCYNRAGQTINNLPKRLTDRFNAQGYIQLLNGGQVSETGSRYLYVTEANIWSGLVEYVTNSVDTSGTDRFRYWRTDSNGSYIIWNENGSQIDNYYYDDGGTLNTLGNNRYRTDFAYLCHNGSLSVILGTNNDNSLITARDREPPSELPIELRDFSTIIAKIIVRKNNDNLTEIDNIATTYVFNASGNVIHNELSGLQGGSSDEYYHLNANDYNNRFIFDGSGISYNGSGHVWMGSPTPFFKSVGSETWIASKVNADNIRLRNYGNGSVLINACNSWQFRWRETGYMDHDEIEWYSGGTADKFYIGGSSSYLMVQAQRDHIGLPYLGDTVVIHSSGSSTNALKIEKDGPTGNCVYINYNGPNYALYVNGSTYINGNFEVDGTITGSLPHFEGESYFNGDVEISGDLVGSNISVLGSIFTNGSIIGSNLNIYGDSVIRGNIEIDGDLTGSNISIVGSIFTGGSVIGSNLNIYGDSRINGDLDVNGNITGSNFYVKDLVFDNEWRYTEYENGSLINGLRILNKQGSEIFKITEDKLIFKGKEVLTK